MRKGLDELALQIADTDRDWWPFLFLRPEKQDKMSSARLALLALLYGSMFGVIANVVVAVSDEGLPFGSFFAIPLLIVAGLYSTFRLTLTNAWNVRAATATRKARFDEANAQPLVKD